MNRQCTFTANRVNSQSDYTVTVSLILWLQVNPSNRGRIRGLVFESICITDINNCTLVQDRQTCISDRMKYFTNPFILSVGCYDVASANAFRFVGYYYFTDNDIKTIMCFVIIGMFVIIWMFWVERICSYTLIPMRPLTWDHCYN